MPNRELGLNAMTYRAGSFQLLPESVELERETFVILSAATTQFAVSIGSCDKKVVS
jgi:hypothetical protein